MSTNSTMHLAVAVLSIEVLGCTECAEVSEPFEIASFVDGLCLNISALVGVARAIERWGYSRSRTRIDMMFDERGVGLSIVVVGHLGI